MQESLQAAWMEGLADQGEEQQAGSCRQSCKIQECQGLGQKDSTSIKGHQCGQAQANNFPSFTDSSRHSSEHRTQSADMST